jgi:hypothetical protein
VAAVAIGIGPGPVTHCADRQAPGHRDGRLRLTRSSRARGRRVVRVSSGWPGGAGAANLAKAGGAVTVRGRAGSQSDGAYSG